VGLPLWLWNDGSRQVEPLARLRDALLLALVAGLTEAICRFGVVIPADEVEDLLLDVPVLADDADEGAAAVE
jgi:hypothetical protein